MNLTFGSVCSGIEAASVAWHPLGWQCAFVSEIEPFPCALLAHHYPKTPNYGDMTKYGTWKQQHIDVLVGGTPCQAFSVAGLRKGLADPRGNLTLTYLAIVAQYRPKWLVWENVPGVLSDKTGAFGALLGGLAELGYGFAYRILDAQYFGVAQRRRRVFVVGHSGGQWQRAAAVLFERESLCGNPPPRRKSGKGTAPTISARTKGGGGLGTDFDLDGGCIPIQEVNKRTGISTTDVRCGIGIGENGDQMFTPQSGAQHGVAQPIGINGTDLGYALRAGASHSGDKGDGGVNCTMVAEVSPTLGKCAMKTPANDFNFDGGLVGESVLMRGREGCDGGGKGPLLSPEKSLTLAANANDQVLFQPEWPAEIAGTLDSYYGDKMGLENQHVFNQKGSRFVNPIAVRRLTPRECERLQGFPDDYTLIPFRNKPAADGPRYKALGNSMAVPVMAWIGKRIEQVEAI